MPLDVPSDFKSSILQLAAVTFAIWDSDCDRNPLSRESYGKRISFAAIGLADPSFGARCRDA